MRRTGPLCLFPEPGLLSSSIRLVRKLLTPSRATRTRLLQGESSSRNLLQRMSLPFRAPWRKNFALGHGEHG